MTDRVHPEVAARAVEAARMVGLDIAGVDVVARDISRPLEDTGRRDRRGQRRARPADAPGAVVGHARGRSAAIVDMLFPEGEDGRIPIVAVTGVNGKTTITRFIAHILRSTGQTVGMTCTDGIYIDDRRIESGDCSGPPAARRS